LPKRKENVYISYDKLVPIYASGKMPEDGFRIKLEHSVLKVD
jgi:hypothetical protein